MSRRLGAAIATVAALLMFSTPNVAYSFTSPNEEPTATPPAETIEPPDEAEEAVLTVEEANYLESHGVGGDVTVQEDENGSVMFVDGEGDWYLAIPEESAGTTVDPSVQPMGFGTATYCTGTFYLPHKVNNTLEWGAQNSCASSNPAYSWYPHYISVMLRDTCQGGLCVVYENLWTETSLGSRYSSVATVSEANYCVNSDDRKYSLVVRIWVRGVQFGPHVSGGIDVDNCHVHPAPGGVD